MCPRREVTPRSGHPGAQTPPLGGVPHRWYGGVHLDTPGQWRGPLPSPVWTRHGAVKQGQSGGPVGATDQGKGKGSREGKTGHGGRGRTQGSERPMGTTAYGGKRSKGRAVGGDWPKGAISCRPKHTWRHANPPQGQP